MTPATFKLVATIAAGISSTLTLPSIDCAGMETRTCTRVFDQIIVEEKAAKREIKDVDCGGADAARCARIAAELAPE